MFKKLKIRQVLLIFLAPALIILGIHILGISKSSNSFLLIQRGLVDVKYITNDSELSII